jgi:uncharacterized protein (TIGR03067 family)
MNLIAAFALVSFTAAPVPKADPVQEAKQNFQGEWKLTWILKEGRPVTKEELMNAKGVVKGDRMTVTLGDDSETGTFTLDPKADPAALDFTLDGEDRAPVVVKGIYRLDKDKLTLCFASPGEDRPKEFASPGGSHTVLIVLERAKK